MIEIYTRKHLVDMIATKHKMSKAQAECLVLDIFDDWQVALKKGRRLNIFPFGSFQVRKRAARKGRNPRTGEPVKIPPKKVVRFTPYAALKSALR